MSEADRTCHRNASAVMRRRRYCEECAVRDFALCSAVPESAAMALDGIAHFKRIPAGQVIYSDHQEVGWLATIISGVIKLVKTQRDGRQQIVGLQFPPDFVGRLYTARSSVIAEATTNLELCCFSKDAFEQLMLDHPSLEQVLHRRALDDLDAAREWMFLLGRKTAREKVACLLHVIACRMARAGCKGDGKDTSVEFDLPLSRIDMADSLGLTTETVCREIRHLKSRGVIATKGRRHVVVSDLAILKNIAESSQD